MGSVWVWMYLRGLMDGSSILMLITSGNSGRHPVFQLLTLLWGSFRAFPQPPASCLRGVVCALPPSLWLPGARGRRRAWRPAPALLSASGFHIHRGRGNGLTSRSSRPPGCDAFSVLCPGGFLSLVVYEVRIKHQPQGLLWGLMGGFPLLVFREKDRSRVVRVSSPEYHHVVLASGTFLLPWSQPFFLDMMLFLVKLEIFEMVLACEFNSPEATGGQPRHIAGSH